MEGQRGVLGETRKEELQESVHVFTRDWAGVDGTPILNIRVSHIDGLVEEYNVGVCVPAMWVVGRGGAVLGNTAGAKLKEKTGGGAAARTPIKPQDKRRVFGRVSGLEEPGKLGRSYVRDYEVRVNGKHTRRRGVCRR